MDVVTVGWLTIDDIVLADHVCHPGVLGGGALYSAVGARLWTPRVGIQAVIGRAHSDTVRDGIRARGIDTDGIAAIEANGLLLWLLHESEAAKQQVPKLASSTPDEIDRECPALNASYKSARAFHVAPQSPAGSLDNVRQLTQLAGKPIVTLDLLSDEFIDRVQYQDLSFLNAITAFLPSEAEVARIWHPADLPSWLRAQAMAHRCHMGVKLGERGAVVCDAMTNALYRIPAYPARVIDTTGAGDGFCGGFIAGLVAGKSVTECAAMATVSASYVVEACGALATALPDDKDREERLQAVMSRVEVLHFGSPNGGSPRLALGEEL